MNNQSQELKDNPRILTLSAIILGYALIGITMPMNKTLLAIGLC